MKRLFLPAFLFLLYAPCHAQFTIAKMVGKNADEYKLGYGLFSFIGFYLNEEENKSICLELMDLVSFVNKEGGSFLLIQTAKGIYLLNLVIKMFSVSASELIQVRCSVRHTGMIV